tara:strand:+ start:127 stop:462 length:336 start_codon:yes stop_codon:yes gene_type:complete
MENFKKYYTLTTTKKEYTFDDEQIKVYMESDSKQMILKDRNGVSVIVNKSFVISVEEDVTLTRRVLMKQLNEIKKSEALMTVENQNDYDAMVDVYKELTAKYNNLNGNSWI